MKTSFLITFLAGISTLIGIIPTYFNNKYKDNIICFCTSFASGVMIAISILSLIPEAFNYLDYKTTINIILTLIFINIGLIISTYIDKELDKKIHNNSLLKVGIVGIIALILHNIPEGITTFIATENNLKIGLMIAIAITLHNIPEGITIAVPIYYSTNSHKLAFFYTLIAGFSEFFGGIIAYIFLKNYINNYIMSIILGITSGIMLQISIFELIPTSLKYKNKLTYLGIILGFIVMYICIILLK